MHYCWIESLFERGLPIDCLRYSAAHDPATSDQRTLWYHVLTELWSDLDSRPQIWAIVEMFLKHGADCSLVAKLRSVEDSTLHETPMLYVKWAGTEIRLANRIGFPQNGYLHHKQTPFRERISHGSIRLQDFVEVARPVPKNKEILIQLIERNQAREKEYPSVTALSNRAFEEAWDRAPDDEKNNVKYRLVAGDELDATRVRWKLEHTDGEGPERIHGSELEVLEVGIEGTSKSHPALAIWPDAPSVSKHPSQASDGDSKDVSAPQTTWSRTRNGALPFLTYALFGFLLSTVLFLIVPLNQA